MLFKNWTLKTLGLLLVLVFFGGCQKKYYIDKTTYEDETITDIVRVFWHEQRHYSFYIQKEGSQEINIKEIDVVYNYDKSVKIFSDVPAGNKMWAKIKESRGRTGFNYYTVYLEIHLHSVKDVEGGGWNHGKFGSGQTQVVQ